MVNWSLTYILISITALLVVAIFIFLVGRNKKQEMLSVLVGLSFAFIIAGIVFGEDALIGYSLIGIGVILAVTDIILKQKGK